MVEFVGEIVRVGEGRCGSGVSAFKAINSRIIRTCNRGGKRLGAGVGGAVESRPRAAKVAFLT